MQKHVLSKSTFIRGVQCEKSLYLNKHARNLRDEISPEQMAVFSQGTNVGELAQRLISWWGRLHTRELLQLSGVR